MSLLTFCQDVADEIGLVRPVSMIGSADVTARRLLQCAKAEGQALYRATDWTILHREYTFETTDGDSNYPVPDDWGRPLGNTAWDRSTLTEMRGSKSPVQWQRLQSSTLAASSFSRDYRIIAGPLAGSILVYPTPSATGDELVIDYISRYWCEDGAGNGKATFTDDSDEMRLDHELFRVGLMWRAKRVLGLDYADDRADYDVLLRSTIVGDMALPITNAAGPGRYNPAANVPEGSWDL